jgi:hemoglobin/transferrin/lactoferrin receptor protein
MKPRRWLLAAGVALVFGRAEAQAGEIRGSAADASGSALVGAQVVLENLATGAQGSTRTDSEGRYRFEGLPAGPYRVAASAPGFSSQAHGVSLVSESEVRFVLALGRLETTVVVSATRSARDTRAVPMRAESISRGQIVSSNAASTGELLVQAPGVTPVASGPFQMRPRLRGLDSTRVLVLVDGERLNNARTATDRAGVEVGLVDPSALESVEIVSGSGSVLYGTDALSGTINMVTNRPELADAMRVTAGLDAYYSSNEGGRRGAFSLGMAAPRLALSLSGGLDSFGDYRSGGRDGSLLEDTFPLHASGQLRQQDTIDSNFPPFAWKAFPDPFNAPYRRSTTLVGNSGSEGDHLNAAGVFRVSETQSLRVKHLRRQVRDVGFPDFEQPQFFQGITLPWSRLDKTSASYEAQSLAPWFARLKATAWAQRQDRKLSNAGVPVQFPAPTAGSFFPINVMRLVIDSSTEQRVKTYGLDVQGTFLVSRKNVLTAGVTAYADDSHDERSSSSQMNLVGSVALGARGPQASVLPRLQPLGPPSVTAPVRVPDATFRDLALFAQDEWDVTPRLRAIAGVRVDAYSVRTQATPGYDIQSVIGGAQPAIDLATLPDVLGDASDRRALTGDIGLVLKLTDAASLVGRYGRSYRHPNLEELLFAGPATIGSIAPNVKVGPERGDNLDFGVKLQARRVRGSLSYFNNTYAGFISTEIVALTPGSSVSQAVNFAKVRIQGFEADLDSSFRAGPVTAVAFGRASYNRGDVLEGANPLTGVRLDGTPRDNITPVKFSGGLRLSDRRNRFWVEYSARRQHDVERVAATRLLSPFLIAQDLFGLQGFTLQRAVVGYDWNAKGTSLGMTLAVENLANTYYREQFQFAPARGRSVTFGLRIRKL